MRPRIAIDGIFFQIDQTGIARVWRSLLKVWNEQPFADHLLILDRAESAPKFSRIRSRAVSSYDYSATGNDREMLQRVCDEEGVDLFISTYYTTPITTPSVFMAYDMIPECTGQDPGMPMWREKQHGLRHASHFISISQNTADDLSRLYPADAPAEKITVARCAANLTLSPRSRDEVDAFKRKYGIKRPYFMTVGRRENYKNAIALFKAFAARGDGGQYSVLCVGGASQLEPESVALLGALQVHVVRLPDEELNAAYCGAAALVYPSEYEGFGLPIVEAMASGCPVITCRRGSIPEVAGDAALFVEPHDVPGLSRAIDDIQRAEIREPLVRAGFERIKHFSWARMADLVRDALLSVAQHAPATANDTALAGLVAHAARMATEPAANASQYGQFAKLRQELAQQWLDVAADAIESAYAGPLGRAHRAVRSSGLCFVRANEDERKFLAAFCADEKTPLLARQLAALLYGSVNSLPDGLDRESVPAWMRQDAVETMPPRPQRHQWGFELSAASQKRLIAAWACLRTEGDGLSQVFTSQVLPLMANSGEVDVPAALGEIPVVDDILAGLARGENDPRARNYRAAAMLFFRMHELAPWDPARIPSWMFDQFIVWTVQQPVLFGDIGEKDIYFQRITSWFEKMRDHLRGMTPSVVSRRLAEPMALYSNLVSTYFSKASMLPLMSARSEIMEMLLTFVGLQLQMTPPPAPRPPGERIRVGILKNHWHVGTETYATLPIIQNLPRDRFEIVLYVMAQTNSEVEAHCRAITDRFVVLPVQVDSQVAQVRQDQCDILFYAINMTAVTHQLVPMAMHRIAPVQVTSICSPATTGLLNMDVFLAGELVESRATAQSDYREKLVKLPGSGLCFDYTFRPPASDYSMSREKVNVDAKTIVFTSGANYFKIVPELRRTWVKLLAAVPGSVLVLYPFGPAWHDAYPAGAFVRCFQELLEAEGVAMNRLILLEPMPSATDVQKVMAITDIYLDSFPYTGATSLLDPLCAGVPPITMAGDQLRFAQGDAVLRELGVPELIAASEEDYIRLAAELANDPALREARRAAIREKMAANPAIFDGNRFGAAVADVFESLIREARAPR